KLHPLLQAISGMAMTDYGAIDDGIYRSEFGFSYEVIANFTKSQYLYHNHIIGAKDFIILSLQC
ncbi:MAG: hypothetical protein ACI4T6_08190, partial [Candidatus Flemingiibacterium sp.]